MLYKDLQCRPRNTSKDTILEYEYQISIRSQPGRYRPSDLISFSGTRFDCPLTNTTQRFTCRFLRLILRGCPESFPDSKGPMATNAKPVRSSIYGTWQTSAANGCTTTRRPYNHDYWRDSERKCYAKLRTRSTPTETAIKTAATRRDELGNICLFIHEKMAFAGRGGHFHPHLSVLTWTK